LKTFAPGDGFPPGEEDWLGEGDGEGPPVAPPPGKNPGSEPQAVAKARSNATTRLHGALGIPQQVTGSDREFPPH